MSATHRPNILLIVSDDHAAPAISCYGSEMNRTPNIDRIGKTIYQNQRLKVWKAMI